jgi:hypothetical protein
MIYERGLIKVMLKYLPLSEILYIHGMPVASYRVDVILFGETCRYSILVLRQSDLPFFHIESLPMCLYIIVLYLLISIHIISIHLSMLIYIFNYCIRVKTL